MHSLLAVTSGAVLTLGLALVSQPAHAQLGGVGGAVGGAAEAAGAAAGDTAGAAAEAGAEGGVDAAAAGTQAGADVGAQAGAEVATDATQAVEGATEGATQAAGQAAGAARGAAEAATQAAGQAGAEAATAADIGTAMGATFSAADKRLSVDSVQQGGIFANAGVQSGDEIVAVAGQQVTSEAQLVDRLRAAADAGNEAIIRVRRDGQLQQLTANLGARTHTTAKIVTDLANIGGNATADSVLRTYVGTRLGGDKGLTIENVQRGSLAARANLTSGDEILAVGGQEVTPENFYPRLQADLLQDGRANIRIRRDGQVYRAPINLCR
jgi:C-terminal processing protease CtpA/Prc